ncbi:hypothetical protein [Microbispora bryophytorum]|uniref:hypothetical protein n=1 Tax=Microbispora bryophytorum TaxID=1460882 RepID=UPI0033F2410C
MDITPTDPTPLPTTPEPRNRDVDAIASILIATAVFVACTIWPQSIPAVTAAFIALDALNARHLA